MPIIKISDRLFLKEEAKLAMRVFKEKYKRIPKGIQKIYENMMLADEYSVVVKEHTRLFGYIKKSKRAKEKCVELEEA